MQNFVQSFVLVLFIVVPTMEPPTTPKRSIDRTVLRVPVCQWSSLRGAASNSLVLRRYEKTAILTS